MQHYDEAVRAGAGRLDAMRSAARHLTAVARRPGDGGLTSSVRGGPIGVNRIDLAVTQIVVIGRNLGESNTNLLREAVEAYRPATAIDNLRRLHAGTAAIVVRPRPDQARDATTSARLARQDQAVTAATDGHILSAAYRAHRPTPSTAIQCQTRTRLTNQRMPALL